MSFCFRFEKVKSLIQEPRKRTSLSWLRYYGEKEEETNAPRTPKPSSCGFPSLSIRCGGMEAASALLQQVCTSQVLKQCECQKCWVKSCFQLSISLIKTRSRVQPHFAPQMRGSPTKSRQRLEAHLNLRDDWTSESTWPRMPLSQLGMTILSE